MLNQNNFLVQISSNQMSTGRIGGFWLESEDMYLLQSQFFMDFYEYIPGPWQIIPYMQCVFWPNKSV
jgi:hypothetical protein